MNSRPFFVLTCCLCVIAVAMSFYVWQVRKQATAEAPPSATPEVVTTPSDAIHKQVTLWVADEDEGVLKAESISIATSPERQRQAEDILRSLLSIYGRHRSPHPLSSGSGVKNVFFVDPGLAIIDISGEFAAGQTSGVFAEELMVASLVQTLSVNFPGILKVKFLVDGKEGNTLAGHVDLSNTYDVSQYLALAKQVSAR